MQGFTWPPVPHAVVPTVPDVCDQFIVTACAPAFAGMPVRVPRQHVPVPGMPAHSALAWFGSTASAQPVFCPFVGQLPAIVKICRPVFGTSGAACTLASIPTLQVAVFVAKYWSVQAPATPVVNSWTSRRRGASPAATAVFDEPRTNRRPLPGFVLGFES